MRSREERAEWAVDHPVRASLLLGGWWGFAMSVFFTVLSAGRAVAFTFGLWMAAGLLLFGPLVVWSMVRKARSTAE